MTTARGSYVEWAPILAGALAALAVSFVLLTFGAAVGLSAVSPWTSTSTTVSAVGLGSAFWILIVSLWSFALGGYLSARLRHRWSDATKPEIEFRDKAQGLLSWATAVTIAAIVASGSLSPSARPAAATDNAITAAAVDKIVRTTRTNIAPANDALRGEVSRVLTANVRSTSIPEADRTFLVRLVQARSDLAPPEAEKRVTEAFTAMRTAADRARKGGIIMGFLIAATLLVAAATAWWAAGVGGEHRDQGTVWNVFGRYEPRSSAITG
jgi:hypothetical protein